MPVVSFARAIASFWGAAVAMSISLTSRPTDHCVRIPRRNSPITCTIQEAHDLLGAVRLEPVPQIFMGKTICKKCAASVLLPPKYNGDHRRCNICGYTLEVAFTNRVILRLHQKTQWYGKHFVHLLVLQRGENFRRHTQQLA